jgi:protein SCO1
MKHKALLLCLVAIVAMAISCARSQTTNLPAAKLPKVFKLTGVVKSVDTEKGRLIVQHGDIPGFMAAMTMPYKAGKSEDITKVSVGDNIQADIVVTDTSADLQNIKVNGHSDASAGAPAETEDKQK